jgi:hypothetical protein
MNDAHKTRLLTKLNETIWSDQADVKGARGEQKSKGEEKANRYTAQFKIP